MPLTKRPLREFPRDTKQLGKLIRSLSVGLTGDDALTDADIPATIARDSEVSAAVAASMTAHVSAGDPHPTYTTAAELAAAVSAHEGAVDPHPGYTTAAELAAALAAYLLPAGPIHLTGIISPAQIAADTDDYNPTGLATATVLRLHTDVSRNLTGIVAQGAGRVLKLFNIGTQDLVLINSSTSTAANQFLIGGNVTLNPSEGIDLWYDSGSARWRSAGKHS